MRVNHIKADPNQISLVDRSVTRAVVSSFLMVGFQDWSEGNHLRFSKNLRFINTFFFLILTREIALRKQGVV